MRIKQLLILGIRYTSGFRRDYDIRPLGPGPLVPPDDTSFVANKNSQLNKPILRGIS